MVTKYVNLGISTSGAAGTELDPLGYDEFRTSVNSNPGDNITYNIKGFHAYTEVAAGTSCFNINHTYDVTLQAWGNIPPRLLFNSPIERGIQISSVGIFTCKRCIIEVQGIVTFGIGVIVFFNGTAMNLENLILIINNTGDAIDFEGVVSFCATDSSGSMKGCSIINLGAGPDEYGSLINCAGQDVAIDSCYFEGPSMYIIEGAVGTITYKNNAYYNINGFVAVKDNAGGATFVDGGGNIDQHSNTTSQLSNIQDIDVMTLPDDIEPLVTSIPPNGIRNNGNPSLGLTYDIMNVARGYNPNPDIGAAEYVEEVTSINTFNVAPQRNGVPVISTINTTVLIAKIQSDNPDTYLDDASKISEVDIYYAHADGRQKKRIKHLISGSDLVGSAVWSTIAKSGSWTVERAKTIDKDGAEHAIGRAVIGSGSDLTLS